MRGQGAKGALSFQGQQLCPCLSHWGGAGLGPVARSPESVVLGRGPGQDPPPTHPPGSEGPEGFLRLEGVCGEGSEGR